MSKNKNKGGWEDRAFGDWASVYRETLQRLVDYYEADARPQYMILCEVIAGLYTRYREIEAAMGKVESLSKLDGYHRHLKRLGEFITQLQRHTEAIRVDVQSVRMELKVYATAITQTITELFPEPEGRARAFHVLEKRLRQLSSGELEEGEAPGPGPDAQREEHQPRGKEALV